MKKIGFTIGKYAPYHKGHKYLIETALKEVDELYVIVYDTPKLNIDVNKKIEWIKNDFPNVHFLKAYNSPSQYGLDDESVKIQMEYLCKIINKIPVTSFYSSEEYGKCVADYLNIENRMIDRERNFINVHASLIRQDLEKYKNFINEDVYKDLKNEKDL